MTLVSQRRTFLRLSMLVAAVAALAMPASASATILVGMESNRELANSDRTPELQSAALDKMQAQGVQVVRVNLGWNEVAPNCGGQTPAALKNHINPCYDWSRVDSLVTLTKVRKQQLLVSFTRAPQWVLNNADPMYMGLSSAQFNVMVAHYSAFMAAAGARYNSSSPIGNIPYWTILNEPNSKTFWRPTPNAQRYALIYARAAVALKSAHPRAVVAPGPTGPASTIKPVPFIRTFLKFAPKYLPGSMAIKRKYINAWAHNPYPGIQSQPSVSVGLSNPNVIGMARINTLFMELDKSPLTRGAKVWATEFGWQTDRDRLSTTPARQAQFIAEAFDWLDSKKRVTIGISYGLTDPIEKPDFQSGTYYNNGIAKPSMRMFQRMVSVPQAGTANKVRRGTIVNVWGRSNIARTKGKLAYRIGSGRWTIVAGQRRAFDGSIRARMRVTAPLIQFAVYDGTVAFTGDTGYGLTRIVRTF